jgi:hypothetical protein
MTTKTADTRLEETHHRIDRLQAKAQESGSDARESIESQVETLRRQEASARAAVKEAHDAKAQEASQRAEAAEDKVRLLETRAKAAEQALAAELAEDKKTFIDAMNADLDEFETLLNQLDAKAAAKTGSAREQAEAAISEARRSMNTVVEHLADVREASGDRWRERKKDVATARTELERKVDDALKKFQ